MSKPYYQDESVTLHHGDALDVAKTLAVGSADCIVTSPPYFGLRDYGEPGQYGLEDSPAEYVESMRTLFAELRRVLADDGTLWLNLGDSYYSGRGKPGLNADNRKNIARRGWVRPVDRPGRDWAKPKDLLGIPWRVAFALQNDGWTLRNDIIWHKPNAMPESVVDRLAGRHEHVFMLSKSKRYWFDLDPIREQYDGDREASRRSRSGVVNKANSIKTAWVPPESRPAAWNDQSNMGATGHQHTWADKGGRNPGDVWEIATQPFPGAHFATMPPKLAQRCIAAGCKPSGTVLDPFSGSGTTGQAAQRLGRKYVGIDLNAEYLELSLRTRLQAAALDFEAGA
ncbi:DNA-methyltransferase [Mycobacteroides abscessus]|uniref:DNA-methyltransferase n=1 Tax=Mycobacteroides abscessus TaxID=36809 RepID=UPI0019D2FBBA|nr:site-specific DNA-methyltransferase [Mycobacteroides abscessus]MBN7389246.1 site-specific DNA-methyltransferase [Mycobacteroides abscessus subsp. abscessus]MBN7419038.1 site-specific DNA-methyltransferase [Mycobacteroides abscessus subsp. abscessus]